MLCLVPYGRSNRRLRKAIACGLSNVPAWGDEHLTIDVFAGEESGSPVPSGSVALSLEVGTRVGIDERIYGLARGVSWALAGSGGASVAIWDPSNLLGQGYIPAILANGGYNFRFFEGTVTQAFSDALATEDNNGNWYRFVLNPVTGGAVANVAFWNDASAYAGDRYEGFSTDAGHRYWLGEQNNSFTRTGPNLELQPNFSDLRFRLHRRITPPARDTSAGIVYGVSVRHRGGTFRKSPRTRQTRGTSGRFGQRAGFLIIYRT